MSDQSQPLPRVRVLLSVHRALLMAITPEMRVIDVAWNHEQIQLRFVLGRESKFDMIELTNEIEAEIEGDFLPNATVSSVVDYIPAGETVALLNPLVGESERIFAIKESE
jgi:hypothetical protein